MRYWFIDSVFIYNYELISNQCFYLQSVYGFLFNVLILSRSDNLNFMYMYIILFRDFDGTLKFTSTNNVGS
jgi:hypothetical protein